MLLLYWYVGKSKDCQAELAKASLSFLTSSMKRYRCLDKLSLTARKCVSVLSKHILNYGKGATQILRLLLQPHSDPLLL
jgi:hypothetical protein